MASSGHPGLQLFSDHPLASNISPTCCLPQNASATSTSHAMSPSVRFWNDSRTWFRSIYHVACCCGASDHRSRSCCLPNPADGSLRAQSSAGCFPRVARCTVVLPVSWYHHWVWLGPLIVALWLTQHRWLALWGAFAVTFGSFHNFLPSENNMELTWPWWMHVLAAHYLIFSAVVTAVFSCGKMPQKQSFPTNRSGVSHLHDLRLKLCLNTNGVFMFKKRTPGFDEPPDSTCCRV